METLLTAMVTWLSVNLGMPAIYDHPRIELVSPEAMHAVRYGGADRPARSALQAARPDRLPEVEALYDDATRTIYLNKRWTGRTPAELSVLVHEMVHHLQSVAGLKYECPAAREKPAYAAQKQWLALFGRDLVEEFKLDPMTLLVRTNCMH
jgi:hypothetical protein